MESMAMNLVIKLGIKGKLLIGIMMWREMTLLMFTIAVDKKWIHAVAAFFAIHLVQVGEKEDDYIGMVLIAKLCHHNLCFGTQDKGIQFFNNFANEEEDVLDAFRIVEVTWDQKNNGPTKGAMLKYNNWACNRKSNVAVSMQ